MKRELGLGRCGLACCLCSENDQCNGCGEDGCPDSDYCVNKTCSAEKGFSHCFQCGVACERGLLGKIKPYTFTLFARQYGLERLLDCLEENEKRGVVYHRTGVNGDYDDFDDVQRLMAFIQTGRR